MIRHLKQKGFDFMNILEMLESDSFNSKEAGKFHLTRHYFEDIVNEKLKKLDNNFLRDNYPYSEGFALMSFKWLNHTRSQHDTSTRWSFRSSLKKPANIIWGQWGTPVSIATKKKFSELSDDEKLEIIQDYLFNQTWREPVSIIDLVKKEGSITLESIERNKKIAENNRIKEIAENKERQRLENEELKKQHLKASTAGKLIDKSIHRVVDSSCNYSGVYLIVNNITLDFYIGESQNISFRRLTHLGQMAAPEKHHRPLIQKHYEQYGVKAFDFYVLERVNNDTENGTARKRIEDFYIKEYNPTYNVDIL